MFTNVRSTFDTDVNISSKVGIQHKAIKFGDSLITLMSFDDIQHGGRNVDALNDARLNSFYDQYPTLELLHIHFYEMETIEDSDYYQGFLGVLNNITIHENQFVFLNGMAFTLDLLNSPDMNHTYFSIFIQRFLPYLLQYNKIIKEHILDVEKFVYTYI